MEHLRYPIGRFDPKAEVEHSARGSVIQSIAAAPQRLREAVAGLDDRQLDTPYREGGWTVRQVVHHVPDSHMNAYIRFKWTLTEDVPAIKTYDEKAWSELVDARTAPIEVSLALLDAVHVRWVMLLESLAAGDYQRRFKHPEWGEIDLGMMLRLYEWHGRHHVAHITNLRKRAGW